MKEATSNLIAATEAQDVQDNAEQSAKGKHVFTGRYAQQQGEIVRDAQNYFGISQEQAIRLATSFASDFGAAIKAGVVESEAKVGKISKEQEVTLEDLTSVKMKRAVATNSMRIVRVIAQMNKLQREADIEYKDTVVGLKPALLEWLTGQKPG